ncbi:MAG: hypothetical protein QME51_00485 [Planctomycetota bacterium]|nr:hypothetical protein [Planctomycetota bacterium]MDI6786836.1 hypothetical protein [Planctomycetota bacterium]
MKYKACCILGITGIILSGILINNYALSQRTTPPTRQEMEIQRLKEALNQKDLATRLWALRSLAKYPASISIPVLLEQFARPMAEDTIALRCAVVYCFSQMEILPTEARDILVGLLKKDLNSYGWVQPEVFEEELKELRGKTGSAPPRAEQGGGGDEGASLSASRRERIQNVRAKLLENYDQKLNWGLLHLRTMQTMDKFKCQQSSDELYRLITVKEMPIAVVAIDTLKTLNNPQVFEKLAKNPILYWLPEARGWVSYAITELSFPYTRQSPREGTEWLKKCLYRLVAVEVTKPGQTNDKLIKALNIMDILSRESCQVYDFTGENNLMREFMDLVNMLKRDNPEIMLYDHDLIIKYIKDEMLMRAMYNIYGNVLKPPPMIIVPTGPTTPSGGSTVTPGTTPEKPQKNE